MFEYQVDLFFISKNDLENQKFRIGLGLIDIFGKYAAVIPIKSKEPQMYGREYWKDCKKWVITEDVLQ